MEQYSSNKFLDECGSKIFPLRKKLITVYHYAGHEAVQGWCRNIELKKKICIQKLVITAVNFFKDYKI